LAATFLPYQPKKSSSPATTFSLKDMKENKCLHFWIRRSACLLKLNCFYGCFETKGFWLQVKKTTLVFKN
jgi:hypothetical protein